MNKRIVSVALKGIAAAMGIAVIVLNLVTRLAAGTAISLLGIGLTALALNALQKE